MARKPATEPRPEPVQISDERRAELTALLSQGPKDDKKFTTAERDARKAAKQELLSSEGPKERFKRLSTARLNEALDVIALIGNLSGPNYEFSQVQIDFMRDQLMKGVNKAMDRFKPKDKEAEKERVEIPDA